MLHVSQAHSTADGPRTRARPLLQSTDALSGSQAALGQPAVARRVPPALIMTHHDTGEVDGCHAVEQQEHGGVGEGAEAEQQARGGQQRGDVQVGEVGGPGGGLVLCGEREGGRPRQGGSVRGSRFSHRRPAGLQRCLRGRCSKASASCKVWAASLPSACCCWPLRLKPAAVLVHPARLTSSCPSCCPLLPRCRCPLSLSTADARCGCPLPLSTAAVHCFCPHPTLRR